MEGTITQGEHDEDGETDSTFEAITSQEEFDKRVIGRLKKEREKITDPNAHIVNKQHYTELMAKAKRLEELEAASKSDLEKANDRATKAEQERDDAKTLVKETSLRASVIAEAAKKNMVDPDAAFALLDRTTLTLDHEGNATNIAEAMDSLLKAKPYLASGGTNRNLADQGARHQANDGADMNQIIRHAAGRT